MESINQENGYRNNVHMVSTVQTWGMDTSYPRISVILGSGKIEMINNSPTGPVFDNLCDVWFYGYFETGGPAATLKDPQVDVGDSLLHDMKRALATKWKTQAGGAAVVNGNKWQLKKMMDEHRFHIPAENKGFVLLKGSVLVFACDKEF